MENGYRFFSTTILAFLLAVSSSSCGLFDSENNRNINIRSLNKAWELVRMFDEDGNEIPLINNELHTTRFADDNTFSGSTTCNEHGGDYFPERDGDLEIENVAVTEVACAEPDHSEEFLNALLEVDEFSTDDGNLALRYGDAGRLEFLERLEN